MDYAIRLRVTKDYAKERAIVLALLAVLIIMLLPLQVFADSDEGRSLTDLFYTDSFSGNWEVFTKMNIVGKIMSYAISAFSLIGIFTVCMRLLLTMLYLSGKNFWDNVEEIKSQGKNNRFFGMGVMLQNTFTAKYGVGLDAFVSFALSLFPNIKAYSEYAEDNKHSGNFDSTDTITTYLLKSALPNMMVILAFTMGFNGVLWQAYGTVVNGVGVAAGAFVNERLDTIVTRALNTGSNYKFGYSADRTKYGDFKQSVAKSIYNKVCSKSTDLSTDTKLMIGQNVDKFVAKYVDYYAYTALGLVDDSAKGTWREVLNKGQEVTGETAKKINAIKVTDQQTGNLEFSVVINNTNSYDNAQTINASLLGLDSNAYYIHLFINKKANADETNYFEVKKAADKKNKGTSNKIDRVTTGK